MNINVLYMFCATYTVQWHALMHNSSWPTHQHSPKQKANCHLARRMASRHKKNDGFMFI